MENITFSYVDKATLGDILPELFRLMDENMDGIAPPESICHNREKWCAVISDALEKPPRRLILIHEGGTIAGFFMYYVNGGTFMMEEIQLSRHIQGKGVFRRLYRFLLPQIYGQYERVEAFVNPKNIHSAAILGYLGLVPVEEDEMIRFRGTAEELECAIYGK